MERQTFPGRVRAHLCASGAPGGRGGAVSPHRRVRLRGRERERTPGRAARDAGLTWVEVLVVGVLVVIAAGFMVPTSLPRGCEPGLRGRCTNNLKQIYSAALQRSHAPGRPGVFPIGPGLAPKPRESRNVLVASTDLTSYPWRWPEGEAIQAKPQDGGHYRPEAEHLDHARVARATLNSSSGEPLACDKCVEGCQDSTSVERPCGRSDRRDVLLSGGALERTEAADLPEATRLAAGWTR